MKEKILNILRDVDDCLHGLSSIKRVLFIADGLYGFLCQYPVIKELEKKNNIRIAVTSVEENIFGAISESKDKLLLAAFKNYYIPSGKAEFMKWNFVVDTHLNSFYPKRKTKRIGMHHGAGFGIAGKKAGLVEQYDAYFGLSHAEEKYLSDCRPNIFTGKCLFFPVGFPKSDSIVNDPVPQKEKLKEFGLPIRKTILITSHWLDVSILSVFQDRIFRLLAESFPNYNIIQTGHPWMWKQNKDSRSKSKSHRYHSITDDATSEIFDLLRSVEKKFDNAHFIPHVVAEELIHMADLMIVDHSSIISTYSLLDRPIVWFRHSHFYFSMPEMEAVYQGASSAFSEPNELVDICKKSLSSPELNSEGRKRMRDVFFNNQGTSATFAADVIANLNY